MRRMSVLLALLYCADARVTNPPMVRVIPPSDAPAPAVAGAPAAAAPAAALPGAGPPRSAFRPADAAPAFVESSARAAVPNTSARPPAGEGVAGTTTTQVLSIPMDTRTWVMRWVDLPSPESVALVDGDDCSTDIERLSVHAIPVARGTEPTWARGGPDEAPFRLAFRLTPQQLDAVRAMAAPTLCSAATRVVRIELGNYVMMLHHFTHGRYIIGLEGSYVAFVQELLLALSMKPPVWLTGGAVVLLYFWYVKKNADAEKEFWSRWYGPLELSLTIAFAEVFLFIWIINSAGPRLSLHIILTFLAALLYVFFVLSCMLNGYVLRTHLADMFTVANVNVLFGSVTDWAEARRHLDMSFVALVVTSVLVGADVAISDYRFGRIAGRSEFLWEWCFASLPLLLAAALARSAALARFRDLCAVDWAGQAKVTYTENRITVWEQQIVAPAREAAARNDLAVDDVLRGALQLGPEMARRLEVEERELHLVDEVEASREDERSRSKRIARNEEVMRFNEMARLQNLAVKGFFKRQEEHLEERTTPDDYDEKKPNSALSEVGYEDTAWIIPSMKMRGIASVIGWYPFLVAILGMQVTLLMMRRWANPAIQLVPLDNASVFGNVPWDVGPNALYLHTASGATTLRLRPGPSVTAVDAQVLPAENVTGTLDCGAGCTRVFVQDGEVAVPVERPDASPVVVHLEIHTAYANPSTYAVTLFSLVPVVVAELRSSESRRCFPVPRKPPSASMPLDGFRVFPDGIANGAELLVRTFQLPFGLLLAGSTKRAPCAEPLGDAGVFVQHVSDEECLSLLWEGESGPCGAAALNAMDEIAFSVGSGGAAAYPSGKPACGPALGEFELRESSVSLSAPPVLVTSSPFCGAEALYRFPLVPGQTHLELVGYGGEVKVEVLQTPLIWTVGTLDSGFTVQVPVVNGELCLANSESLPEDAAVRLVLFWDSVAPMDVMIDGKSAGQPRQTGAAEMRWSKKVSPTISLCSQGAAVGQNPCYGIELHPPLSSCAPSVPQSSLLDAKTATAPNTTRAARKVLAATEASWFSAKAKASQAEAKAAAAEAKVSEVQAKAAAAEAKVKDVEAKAAQAAKGSNPSLGGLNATAPGTASQAAALAGGLNATAPGTASQAAAPAGGLNATAPGPASQAAVPAGSAPVTASQAAAPAGGSSAAAPGAGPRPAADLRNRSLQTHLP